MSFGLSAIGLAILIGGLIYAAHLVHAHALDCRWRNHTLRCWNSLRCKGDVPERSCGITLP
jgi:hypothetical protein